MRVFHYNDPATGIQYEARYRTTPLPMHPYFRWKIRTPVPERGRFYYDVTTTDDIPEVCALPLTMWLAKQVHDHEQACWDALDTLERDAAKPLEEWVPEWFAEGADAGKCDGCSTWAPNEDLTSNGGVCDGCRDEAESANDCGTCGGSGGGSWPMHCTTCGGSGRRRALRI